MELIICFECTLYSLMRVVYFLKLFLCLCRVAVMLIIIITRAKGHCLNKYYLLKTSRPCKFHTSKIKPKNNYFVWNCINKKKLKIFWLLTKLCKYKFAFSSSILFTYIIYIQEISSNFSITYHNEMFFFLIKSSPVPSRN